MSGRSKVPKYDRLWVDCSEEEARLSAKHGNAYDENQALAARSSHQKGKKRFVRKYFYRKDRDDRRYDGSSYSSNRRDYSKVQCFVAKNLVISNEIALRRRVSREHQELRLTMSPRASRSKMSILQIQISFYSQLFQV